MPRRVAIAALAVAQLAILALGPVADPPPAAPEHRHHIAAESAPGCETYHDEHCVLCRVLSRDPAGSAPVSTLAVPGPLTRAAPVPSLDVAHAPDPFSPLHARAPPTA